MIAIVCGGRDYTDAARLRFILDQAVIKLGLDTIIEGECPTPVNADKLARKWAEDTGKCSVIAVPAETIDGKFQGPARNNLMLAMLLRSEDEKAVIAFRPGPGNGTRHMVGIAERAGVRVIKVDWE